MWFISVNLYQCHVCTLSFKEGKKDLCTHCVTQEPAEVHGLDVAARQGANLGLPLCCQSAGWPTVPPHLSALK